MNNLTKTILTVAAIVAPTLSIADINNHAIPATADSATLDDKIAEATTLFNSLYGNDAQLLLTTINNTAESNSQIIWDQNSGSPWAQKGVDLSNTIASFQYQQSATQHQIRLKDANGNAVFTSFNPYSKSDTQSLILDLSEQVFTAGYENGFEAGYTDGYTLGYIDGYDDGYSDAESNDGEQSSD